MSLKIRLSRQGRKKRPFYRVVVADSRAPRDGRLVEQLGHYNPFQPAENSQIDIERVKYWLSVGAQYSSRVGKLLDAHGLNLPQSSKPSNKSSA